jgi:hypothetical protein
MKQGDNNGISCPFFPLRIGARGIAHVYFDHKRLKNFVVYRLSTVFDLLLET